MSLTWKLLLAHARQQRIRLLLTTIAMVAAVGVVLWIISSYEMIASRFDTQTEQLIGDYSVFVVPKSTRPSS